MKREVVKASLVVVGGGLAGVCASVQASRLGIPTVLVQNRPVLGGNSSSEIRVWTRGATGAGNLFSEEMGILGRIKMRNLFANEACNPVFWDEVLMEAVLKEKNIRLLLNTNIDHLAMSDGKVIRISGIQQASEIAYILESDYYIDATGDGILGAQAKVPYMIGDSEYFADDKRTDRELLSSSLLFYTKDTGNPVGFVPPDFAYDMDYIERVVNKGGRIVNEKMTGSDCWWCEYGGFLNTITDDQKIGFELKRIIYGIWNYIKNSGKYPEAETYTLEWAGNLPGKRESRRMITDYLLTEQDIITRKQFPDEAFYGGWYMDMHPSGGIQSEGENCIQRPTGVYSVPFRTLYCSAVPNLLFAGRIIGTEREAFSSTRVMNTCALSGQAAAVLAFGCIRWGLAPRDVLEGHVQELQSILLREDMFLPGKKLPAEENLASSAKLTASSVGTVTEKHTGDFLELSERSFLIIPVKHASAVQLFLRNGTGSTNKLNVELYKTDLPSRMVMDKYVCLQELEIIPGKQSIRIELPETVRGHFVQLVFRCKAGLEIERNAVSNPCVLFGYRNSSDYQDPCVRLEEQELYDAKNAVNGFHRPYGQANLWISKPEEAPWICLEWEKKVTVREIRLFLDPELSMELPSSCGEHWAESHVFTPRRGMPPQLVKTIRIEICEDEIWREFLRVCNNWERMVVLGFEPVNVRKIKVTFEESWGDPRAHLYQICVYE